MRPRVIAALAAAGLAAAYFFAPVREAVRNLVETQGAYVSALLTMVSLGIALAALALAAWAMHNAHKLRSDIAQLTRSLDGALSEIDQRSSNHAKTIDEINTALKSEIASLSSQAAMAAAANDDGSPEAEAADAQTAENVIPHPSVRKRAGAGGAPAEEDADARAPARRYSQRDMETVISSVTGSEGPLLSLQPIISVSESEAVGFETFAHMSLAEDRVVDVQRLSGAPQRFDLAGFERAMVIAAAKAARRQLGDQAERMPLHCSISAALLDDPDELSVIAELFSLHPALSRSLVLSLPATLFRPGKSGRIELLETLSEVGMRFAAENWNGTPDAEALRNGGAAFVKLGANALLGLQKTRAQDIPADELVEAAAKLNLPVIATDVETDEQAIGLIDDGIDLMCGIRFGDPRPLRQPDPGSQGKVVQLQDA